MNFTISYAVTACNEHEELDSLLKMLSSNKRNEDEIVIQLDKDNHTQGVLDVVKKYNLKKNLFKFTNSSSFKNNLRKLCKGDYIFHIEANEIPADETIENLDKIIESNINIDVFVVPTMTLLQNGSDKDFSNFKLSINQHGFINWPSYQHRISKNQFNIKWGGSLGKILTGAHTGVQLPETVEYATTKIIPKDKIRKEYSDNITLCLCVANSEDCLDRFFNWSLPRFENILIVESESEDSTSEILKNYKSKYPDQIELHFKKIKDIASQKQHCLNLAKTEWKLIIDADEIIENHNWNMEIEYCEEHGIDLCFLPRYNLQKDESHYLSTAYPDLQPRLVNSRTKFSTNPMHQTHHVMEGYRNQKNLQDCHIIHWGHIRSEEQNLWKSNMRKKFAKTDACDGDGLLKSKNWFHERNEVLGFNQNIEKLPQKIHQLISSN